MPSGKNNADFSEQKKHLDTCVNGLKITCFCYLEEFAKGASIPFPKLDTIVILPSFAMYFDMHYFYTLHVLCICMRKGIEFCSESNMVEHFNVLKDMDCGVDQLLRSRRFSRFNALFEHCKMLTNVKMFKYAVLAAKECAEYSLEEFGEQSFYYAESKYLEATAAERWALEKLQQSVNKNAIRTVLESAISAHEICIGIYRHVYGGKHFLYKERAESFIRCLSHVDLLK